MGQPLFTATFPFFMIRSMLDISLCCAALPLLIKVGKAHRGPVPCMHRQADRGDDLYSVDAVLQGLLIDRGEWRSTIIAFYALPPPSLRAHRSISLSLGGLPLPFPIPSLYRVEP